MVCCGSRGIVGGLGEARNKINIIIGQVFINLHPGGVFKCPLKIKNSDSPQLRDRVRFPGSTQPGPTGAAASRIPHPASRIAPAGACQSRLCKQVAVATFPDEASQLEMSKAGRGRGRITITQEQTHKNK